MPTPRRLALVIVTLVVLDQVTKSWAESALDDGRIINVVWTLRFALGYNSGFALGRGLTVAYLVAQELAP